MVEPRAPTMWEYLSPFERHDLFNIVSLLPVTTMNLLSFGHPQLRRPLLYAFGVYTAADSAWVIADPKSVKDPSGILVHHALSLGLLTVPILCPEFTMYAALTLTAEFNTWVLITKRHVTWRPLRVVLEGLFYTSWVAVRLVLYPWLWSRYMVVCMGHLRNNTVFHPTMISPLVMGALCIMQFKWSWELVRKYIFPRAKRSEQ